MAVSVDVCGKSRLMMRLTESLRPFIPWLGMKLQVLGNLASSISTLMTASLLGRRMVLKIRNAREGGQYLMFLIEDVD